MDEPEPETATTAETDEAPVVLVMLESDSTDVCAADGTGC
jgi:hypothetical protein